MLQGRCLPLLPQARTQRITSLPSSEPQNLVSRDNLRRIPLCSHWHGRPWRGRPSHAPDSYGVRPPCPAPRCPSAQLGSAAPTSDLWAGSAGMHAASHQLPTQLSKRHHSVRERSERSAPPRRSAVLEFFFKDPAEAAIPPTYVTSTACRRAVLAHSEAASSAVAGKSAACTCGCGRRSPTSLHGCTAESFEVG